MRFLSSIRIIRVALALAVAFWMAGAGCMLGCENMVSAAMAHEADAEASSPASGSNIVVAADACASMHAHDCCARRGTQSAAKSRVSSSTLSAIKPSETPAASLSTRPAMPAKHALSSVVSGDVVVAALAAPFSTMMDCPLAVNATAALSKARPDESGGDLLLPHTADSFSYFKEQLTALTPPSLLPNRGHTYLRCCVFLI